MANGHQPNLHWADYLVTVLSLLIALGIGIFFAIFKGGQKTREQYMVGDRRMGLVPVSVSLFITFQSAISLIGVPADIYSTGTMLMYFYLGMCLAYVLGCFTVVPVIYPLKLTSVYEYLWARFQSTGIRYMVTLTGMMQLSMYMAIALFSPSLVLQAVVGLPLWVSLALAGTIGTIYTTIGGIKSVLWTDVFQTIMMFIGLLVIVIKGIMYVGGMSELWNISMEGGRIEFDEVDIRARHSVWGVTIGGCMMWLMALFGQSSVQRISSLPTQRHARWCFLLNIPLCLLLGLTMFLMGTLIYSYFQTIGCDPYAAGYIPNKNQVGPYFVLHLFRETPGMTGLYLSMLFCGSLSTLSSGINSLAANTVQDVLARPLTGVKDSTVTIIAKCIVLGYGCLSVGLAYLMKDMSGPVSQVAMSIDGSVGSPVLGIMFLGAGFPRCNTYGAAGGFVVGLLASLTMGIGSSFFGRPTLTLPSASVEHCEVFNGSAVQALTDSVLSSTPMTSSVYALVNSSATTPNDRYSSVDDYTFWDLPYFWLTCIGFVTTVISGTIISLLTGCMKEEKPAVDPRLIFPLSRKLFGLPEPTMEKEEGELDVLASKNYQDEKIPDESKETAPFMTKGIQPASMC